MPKQISCPGPGMGTTSFLAANGTRSGVVRSGVDVHIGWRWDPPTGWTGMPLCMNLARQTSPPQGHAFLRFMPFSSFDMRHMATVPSVFSGGVSCGCGGGGRAPGCPAFAPLLPPCFFGQDPYPGKAEGAVEYATLQSVHITTSASSSHLYIACFWLSFFGGGGESGQAQMDGCEVLLWTFVVSLCDE